jgi:hypothetical protein
VGGDGKPIPGLQGVELRAAVFEKKSVLVFSEPKGARVSV